MFQTIVCLHWVESNLEIHALLIGHHLLTLSDRKYISDNGKKFMELHTKMLDFHCFAHCLLNKVQLMKNTFEIEGKM